MSTALASRPRAAINADADFTFGVADFERVRIIYQRAGISLNPGKQAMVYSRLSRRLLELRQLRQLSAVAGKHERRPGRA